MLTANDWAQIVVVVTLISALTKPILEQHVPGFKVSSPMHDNLLRLLNLALCLAGVLWVAAARNDLSIVSTPALLYYTAQQFIGSQGLYFVATRAGQSIGDSTAAASIQQQIQQALNGIGALAGLAPRTPTLRATGTVITPTPTTENTGTPAEVRITTTTTTDAPPTSPA